MYSTYCYIQYMYLQHHSQFTVHPSIGIDSQEEELRAVKIHECNPIINRE